CVPSAFGHEEVDANVKVETFERAADFVYVRKTDHHVVAHRNQSANLTFAHLRKHLDNRDARLRQFLFRQSPNFADVFAMFGVRNRTLTWKLIRFLTVLATALAVALSGYGSVTAARCSNLSSREYQVDIREDVVDAIRV